VTDAKTGLSPEEVGRLDLFRDLPPADLAAVARCCRVRRFDAREHILHLHERSSELFFVLEGEVRVLLYSPAGRDVSFRDLAPGEVFGELAAIDGGPRSASVVATEPSRLAVMPARDFLELLRTHPGVAEALMRHLVSLIRRYSQRVYELSTFGVEERVRMQLLRLAWEQDPHGDTVVLDPAPTLAELASLVSTTREAVSREISRLARDGIVERRGRALVVRDRAALSATVESEIA